MQTDANTTEHRPPERVLLLVDDEENIRKALVRALRREGYTILLAADGPSALELLKQQAVGVILSDQRMPGMSGSEFLSKAKALYPDTVRICLSGYTELKSVTAAINEGAIYKFLTKPWDDELLAANIKDAFEYFELKDENKRLDSQLARANAELFKINQELERRVEERTREAMINLRVLKVSQEVLEHLPIGVLGIGADGLVAVANQAVLDLVDSNQSGLIGLLAKDVLPESIWEPIRELGAQGPLSIKVDVPVLGAVQISLSPMGETSSSRGAIVLLTRVS